MSTYARTVAIAGLLLTAANVGAQQRDACPGGWGAAFGITGLQCPSCSTRQDSTGRRSYTFFAEPVVLQAGAASGLVAGDIIQAVNGQPITTSAGAEQFIRPPMGPNEITVRRGRDRHAIPIAISAAVADCERSLTSNALLADSTAYALRTAIEQLQSRLESTNLGPSASIALRDSLLSALKEVARRIETIRRREIVRRPKPAMFIVDGMILRTGGAIPPSDYDDPPSGGFGFAVACAEPCTAATGSEGKTMFTYYKYDSYPSIANVRFGSAAERAGMKVGDVITKVDGLSVLEDAGALRLSSMRWKESVHLTVLRDGKELGYLIKAR